MDNSGATPRIAYSIAEAAAASSLSKQFLRKQIRLGKLPAKRVGRRILVLPRDLTHFLENAEKR